MIRGIAHVAYQVRDLEASLDFYCRGLGLREAFRLYDEEGRTRIVYIQVAGDDFIELFPPRGEAPAAVPGRAPSFRHLSLEVDDMGRTLQELAARGVHPENPPRLGKDHNWQAWLVDPDGNRIELMQISPESPQHEAALAFPAPQG